MAYPRMYRLRQQFDAPRLDDVAGEVDRQLTKLGLSDRVKPGESVAITVGSRGIANIAVITKAIVDHFKSLSAKPFIVPAMGSHGGGTAEGQRSIIEGYGVTEEFIGAEIRASMNTVVVGTTPEGISVYFDRHAFEADHVVVAGRVKPHTGFVGDIESGLHKMMLIGLGKHDGAKLYHRAILDYSFAEIIDSVAKIVIPQCNILAGVAIVENAYDETGLIEAVAIDDFEVREKSLLLKSKQWMPQLPFDKIDLLIIDKIGKNLSGTGMDTNIVGRKYADHRATDKDSVDCTRIYIRGLSAETHGNACGLGLAEFTNQRTIDAVDRVATRINALTGGHPTAASSPLTLDSDHEVFEGVMQTLGLARSQNPRIVQISNTLHLKEVLVSEAYADDLKGRDDLEILDGPFEVAFDDAGNFSDV